MSNYTFYYDNYSLHEQNLLAFTYHYVDGNGAVIGAFTEKYQLPVALDITDDITKFILRQLHIIIGVSYYKSLLGEVILPYELTGAEASYLNEIYDNGLGEYAYINKIADAIQPFAAINKDDYNPREMSLDGAILGIGGGKDSIVAVELLKGIGLPTTTLEMTTGTNHGQSAAVMEQAGLSTLEINRYFDTSLAAFNATYAGKNGHVPLSAILAWLGLLMAYTQKHKYVLMANESASSSGNILWNGKLINHQWSKSYDFESLTQTYVHHTISPDLHYFSPIRPYSSLMVMELFAKLGNPYIDKFTSCNLVLRINAADRPNGRWCGRCAKCLSTWLLLTPWTDANVLERIFNKNMYDDLTLLPDLKALLGLEGHKPLDCVGTTEELRAVTRHALSHRSVPQPLLDAVADENIDGPDIQSLVATRGEHNLPPALQKEIERYISEVL